VAGAKDGPSSSTGEVTVLSGRSATETAVTHALAGHRIVHLASHGFFLDASCLPAVPGSRAVGALARAAAHEPIMAENPLVLAGLALAGANGVPGGDRDDDGILTAEEVAGLNLLGTEWAVLSACDTGAGQIAAGEGVIGLRRAFQVAGVRTVIMSLWSVDDQAARTWMRNLYEARFDHHLSTSESVRAASARVLADRRMRAVTTHPFFWAAFVAVGDWN
jgi:CHAT domain-containing protein